ncbi:MAG: sigma-70 family RNA polymerase sigma factor [Ferruginibacter sp.]
MSENLHNVDEIYWKRLRNGDSQALGFLYDKYVDKLFVAAMLTTKNRELAKDSVQEVFIELWNYRHTIADIQYSQSYLTKVLRNILFKKLKKENPAHHYQLHESFVSPEETIENVIISRDTNNEKKNNLKQALSKLSTRQKQVLQLHFNEGLSYEQIAEKLSINYQSVNNLAFRTILRLRNLMFGSVFFVNVL